MPLDPSGRITLLEIAEEFDPDYDDNLPYRLTDFYADGTYVPDGATNGAGDAIPESGTIRLTDFYGASAVAPITVTIGSIPTSVNEGAQDSLTSVVGNQGTGTATLLWTVDGDAEIVGAANGSGVQIRALEVDSDGGSYNATLTATRGTTHRGRRSTGDITVNNVPLTASITGGASTIRETTTITLSASSNKSDGLSYAWTVAGDGSGSSSSSSITVTADSVGTSGGSITVDLTINRTTARGGSETANAARVTIAVSDQLPVASAPSLSIGSVADIDEGDSVQISVTPTGGVYDTIAYAWVVRSGGGTISGSGSTVTYNSPSVTADTEIVIDVDATVRGTGTNARSGTSDTTSSSEDDSVRFDVNNVAAPVSVTISGPTSLREGATGTFTASASGGTGGPYDYDWSGTSGGTVASAGTSSKRITAGTGSSMTVRVRATDRGTPRRSGSDTHAVNIVNETFGAWSAWGPATSTVCEGVSFEQTRTRTSNFGNTETGRRDAIGTDDCSSYPRPILTLTLTEAGPQIILRAIYTSSAGTSRNGQPTAATGIIGSASGDVVNFPAGTTAAANGDDQYDITLGVDYSVGDRIEQTVSIATQFADGGQSAFRRISADPLTAQGEGGG